jgi:cytochrome c-type biogenesis protein
MASQTTLGRPLAGRGWLYFALALLVLAPLLAFGLGPLTDRSFGLRGPGGPILAFSAGVLSFVSPCVLPIVPIYVAHLSGASIENGRLSASRRVTFTHALAFILGLSLIFIVLGTSVGLLGSYFFKDNQRDFERVAGVLLVAMGVLLVPSYGARSPIRAAVALLALTAFYLFIAEVADLRGDRPGMLFLGIVLLVAWLRFAGYLPLNVFSRTFEVDLARNRGVGYGRSALIGAGFALGWTPCVGPVLGSILTLSSNTAASTGDAWTATYLLAAYSAGFSVPFLITGLALSDATRFFRKLQPYMPVVEAVSAVVIVGLGLLLWYGKITGLYDYFSFADFNQGL